MARILRLFPSAGDLSDPLKRRKRERARKLGAASALVLVFIILTAAVSPWIPASLPEAKAGMQWQGPVLKAPHDISVVDEASAAEARRRVEETHVKVFRVDNAARDKSLARINKVLAAVAALDGDALTSAALARDTVLRKTNVALEVATVRELIANRENRRVAADMENIVTHLHGQRGITADKGLFEASARSGRHLLLADSGETSAVLAHSGVLGWPGETFDYLETRHLAEYRVAPELSRAYFDLASQTLEPNIIHDRQTTQERKAALLADIETEIVFPAGTILIRTGDNINPVRAAAIEKYRTHVALSNLRRLAGNSLLVLFVMVCATAYVMRHQQVFAFSARDILLAATPALLALLAGRAWLGFSPPGDLGRFAFPAAMAGMVYVMVYNARFAATMVTLSTLLFGATTNMDFSHVLPSLFGGYASVGALTRFRERQQVLTAGLYVSVANLAAALCFTLAENRLPGMSAVVGAFANGIGCYVLGLATLPLLERFFRVTTNWRLMELTSGNHPLFRQMEELAPGSFQHVLNVTKLAESGADAVGANFLLVRAGAYFHDLGKMVKPKYFTENQVTAEERRIHSKLSPYMSTLIIRNHVKDGVELARRYRLPERVVDFIPQHHGTSLIKYFYVQALQKAEANEMVGEDEFRYPGPKPQSIEAAIVMIADSVEAIATAKLNARTVREEEVRKVVRDAVNDKFQDGQFDECRMMLRDLHEISEALVHALLSRYHQRVDYPMLPRREVRDITKAPEPAASLSGTAPSPAASH